MDYGYMAFTALFFVVVLSIFSTALFQQKRVARRTQMALASLNGAVAAIEQLYFDFHGNSEDQEQLTQIERA